MKVKPKIDTVNKSPYFGTIMINKGVSDEDEDEIVEGSGETLTPFNSEIMLSGIYRVPDNLFLAIMNKLKGRKDYYKIIFNFADINPSNKNLKGILLESYNLLNSDNKSYDNNFKTNAPIRISKDKYFKIKQKK